MPNFFGASLIEKEKEDQTHFEKVSKKLRTSTFFIKERMALKKEMGKFLK